MRVVVLFSYAFESDDELSKNDSENYTRVIMNTLSCTITQRFHVIKEILHA